MTRQGQADWNPKQERAALALACGKTHRMAALESGAGERTIRLWLDDPAFRALVGGYRDQLLAETIGRLTEASTRAVEVLAELLDSEQDGIRLRAATSILDALIKAREHGELASRVAAVEGDLAGGDHDTDRRRGWGT